MADAVLSLAEQEVAFQCCIMVGVDPVKKVNSVKKVEIMVKVVNLVSFAKIWHEKLNPVFCDALNAKMSSFSCSENTFVHVFALLDKSYTYILI